MGFHRMGRRRDGTLALTPLCARGRGAQGGRKRKAESAAEPAADANMEE